MATESNTGIVDNALMHRRRYHAIEVAVQAAFGGCFQGIEHIAAISGVELPCNPAMQSGDGQHGQFAASRRGRITS